MPKGIVLYFAATTIAYIEKNLCVYIFVVSFLSTEINPQNWGKFSLSIEASCSF